MYLGAVILRNITGILFASHSFTFDILTNFSVWVAV
jgi:hypothetical protein